MVIFRVRLIQNKSNANHTRRLHFRFALLWKFSGIFLRIKRQKINFNRIVSRMWGKQKSRLILWRIFFFDYQTSLSPYWLNLKTIRKSPIQKYTQNIHCVARPFANIMWKHNPNPILLSDEQISKETLFRYTKT